MAEVNKVDAPLIITGDETLESTINPVKNEKCRAALQSLFIGDALSMPVHWFYNPLDIQRVFPGGITQMEAAPEIHPSSIMSLHSTTAGGRKSVSRGRQPVNAAREIVGDVILRGKQQYWGIPHQHYHRGMQAGDNTLNACCARVMIRGLIKSAGVYSKQSFLEDYIEFMTAEDPQHPDTYAESWHRGFFANRERGLPMDQCGAVTHDTPSVGGLVAIVPLALKLLIENGGSQTEVDSVCKTCREQLMLTHPDELLARVCDSMVALFAALLQRDPNDDALLLLVRASRCISGVDLNRLWQKAPGDMHVVGGTFSTACYITDSWPSLLYLAGKYQHSAEAAMLANTNLGGENAHRGSVLGAIVSLIQGQTSERLLSQLLHRDEITTEIEQLLLA